jgi:hypothetical protein
MRLHWRPRGFSLPGMKSVSQKQGEGKGKNRWRVEVPLRLHWRFEQPWDSSLRLIS